VVSVSCTKLQDMLDAYQTEELAPAEQRRLEEHLAGCVECRDELAALRRLQRRLLAAAPAEPQVDPGLGSWVIARSRGGTSSRRPGSLRRKRGRRPRTSPNRALVPLLAAAALALLIPLGWLALGGSASSTAPPGLAERPATPAEPLTPAEPPSADAPVDPPSAPDPVVPPTTPDPVDPESSPDPVEPASSPDPVEPASSPDPVEPASSPDPVEPASSPDPVEPASSPDPVESPTRLHTAVVVAWLEQGQVEGGAREVVRGGSVRASGPGARLRLEGGGVLLLAAKAEVVFTDGMALTQGEALLDLRAGASRASISVGQAEAILQAGARCLLEAQSGGKRGRVAVLDGVCGVAGRQVPAARAVRIRAGKVGKPARWRAVEPRWARRLMPRGTTLVSLADDLEAGLWTTGTVETLEGRLVIRLAPVTSRYTGVSANRRPGEIFRTGGDIEVEVALKVEQALRVSFNFFDSTRQDNYQWHVNVEPGGVRRFRTRLDSMVAADGSGTPLGDDHALGGIGALAGSPGETPSVVLVDLVVRRLEREE